MALRVLVINPSGEETLGVLQDVLEQENVVIDEQVTKECADLLVSNPPSESVRIVSAFPETCQDHDCMILLGSPLGVLTDAAGEEDQTPVATMAQTEALVRDFTNAEKPVLGLCLGSQLIARAYGGKVLHMPKEAGNSAMPVQFADKEQPQGTEFGWHVQDFTEDAKTDRILGPALENSGATRFMQWHSDMFTFPEGAMRLSTRPTCQTQGFRMGKSTYAFQYHIEVGKTLGESWYDDYITGADSFEERENWDSLSERDKQAMEEEIAARVADGSIEAAENFTRAVMRGLLKQAAEVRSRCLSVPAVDSLTWQSIVSMFKTVLDDAGANVIPAGLMLLALQRTADANVTERKMEDCITAAGAYRDGGTVDYATFICWLFEVNSPLAPRKALC